MTSRLWRERLGVRLVAAAVRARTHPRRAGLLVRAARWIRPGPVLVYVDGQHIGRKRQ